MAGELLTPCSALVVTSTQQNVCSEVKRGTCSHRVHSRKNHDDVIKWKHFPCYWPFVRGIHRSPVNSPHKSLWRGALMFSLICVWINDWVNNREAGDLRRYRAHYDVIIVCTLFCYVFFVVVVPSEHRRGDNVIITPKRRRYVLLT